MSPDQRTSTSKKTKEHIKSLGKDAFSKLEGRLGPENKFKMRFSNGCDIVGIEKLCPDSEKDKKILVDIVKSKQPFIAFVLGESGIVEHFHSSNISLFLEGKEFPLNRSLHISGPAGPLGCSIKDEISAIELGIILAEKIDKSINKGELEPFDLDLGPSNHS
jgi:hypothetical protein